MWCGRCKNVCVASTAHGVVAVCHDTVAIMCMLNLLTKSTRYNRGVWCVVCGVGDIPVRH